MPALDLLVLFVVKYSASKYAIRHLHSSYFIDTCKIIFKKYWGKKKTEILVYFYTRKLNFLLNSNMSKNVELETRTSSYKFQEKKKLASILFLLIYIYCRNIPWSIILQKIVKRIDVHLI